jgi:pimeloyl-ACP methyl ester carboxylesterase
MSNSRSSFPFLTLAFLVGLTTRVGAADQPITGDQLLLRTQQIGVRSRDVAISLGGGEGSADDPVLHGGSVRVLSIAGDVFDTTYGLPTAGWRYMRRRGQVVGYRYKGTAPIGFVRVKAGKTVRVAGRSAGLAHTLAASPDPVRVVLKIGAQQYCMRFGGTSEFTAGSRYVAHDAAAPDICPLPYGDDSSWLCRPGMANNQCFVNSLDSTIINPDLSTTPEPHTGNENQPFDCFYVYPTVDLGGAVGNHLDVTQPSYVALTLDPLLAQGARFNAQCRIFAPHYRQVTLSTFGDPNAAIYQGLAYRDVLDAWRLYLKNDNAGRNVVVIAHSQGTLMTTRLLQEEFDPSVTLRSRLIAALLIGGSVIVPQGGVVGGSFQNIPLCQSAAETGCVLAYRSYADGFPPTGGSNSSGGPTMDTACTNPAAPDAVGSSVEGAFTGTYFPTHTNQPLFQLAPDPGFGTAFVKYESFYSGACVKDDTNHSYLRIRVTPLPGDLRTNPIPFTNFVLDPGFLGTHILDYSWATEDLLSLVAAKAAAMP